MPLAASTGGVQVPLMRRGEPYLGVPFVFGGAAEPGGDKLTVLCFDYRGGMAVVQGQLVEDHLRGKYVGQMNGRRLGRGWDGAARNRQRNKEEEAFQGQPRALIGHHMCSIWLTWARLAEVKELTPQHRRSGSSTNTIDGHGPRRHRCRHRNRRGHREILSFYRNHHVARL